MLDKERLFKVRSINEKLDSFIMSYNDKYHPMKTVVEEVLHGVIVAERKWNHQITNLHLW